MFEFISHFWLLISILRRIWDYWGLFLRSNICENCHLDLMLLSSMRNKWDLDIFDVSVSRWFSTSSWSFFKKTISSCKESTFLSRSSRASEALSTSCGRNTCQIYISYVPTSETSLLKILGYTLFLGVRATV